MINPENFTTMMALIAERTPNVPDDKTLALYYTFLSPRLTDEEFKEAGMAVFAEAQFFPAPIRFLEIRATREWNKILQLVHDFTPPHVKEGWMDQWEALTLESRGAIKQIGGMTSIKKAMGRDVMRTRTTFIATYEEVARDAAVDAQALEAPPEPERLEAGESDVGLPLGWEGVEIVDG